MKREPLKKVKCESLVDDAPKWPPWIPVENFAPAVTSDSNDTVWVEQQCPGCRRMVLETDDSKVTQRNTWHVACYDRRGDRRVCPGCRQTVGANEDTHATASRSWHLSCYNKYQAELRDNQVRKKVISHVCPGGCGRSRAGETSGWTRSKGGRWWCLACWADSSRRFQAASSR